MSDMNDYDRASNALRQARSIATLLCNLDPQKECAQAIISAGEVMENLIDTADKAMVSPYKAKAKA